MTDIIERLRNYIKLRDLEPLCNEAADEIERLRAEIERLRRTLKRIEDTVTFSEEAYELAEMGARRTRGQVMMVRIPLLGFRFVWNYKGHTGGFFSRGPNWIQLIFPPSRKRRRAALILWRNGTAGK
jgi:hypothetical protein